MNARGVFLICIVALVCVYLFVPGARDSVNSWFKDGANEPARDANTAEPQKEVEARPVGEQVWWTRDGDVFHCNSECPRYARERGVKRVGIPRSSEEADRIGLKPCPQCCARN